VALTKYLIRRMNKKGTPCILYTHPYEVGPELPDISEISLYRRFRHYYNCNNGDKRLRKILKTKTLLKVQGSLAPKRLHRLMVF